MLCSNIPEHSPPWFRLVPLLIARVATPYSVSTVLYRLAFSAYQRRWKIASIARQISRRITATHVDILTTAIVISLLANNCTLSPYD